MAVSFRVKWEPSKFIKTFDKANDAKLKAIAEEIASDARSLVPVDSGNLRSSIEVRKSTDKEHEYVIGAQFSGGYDRFYASFIELGTHKTRNIKAKPFLRPALYRKIPKMKKAFNAK